MKTKKDGKLKTCRYCKNEFIDRSRFNQSKLCSNVCVKADRYLNRQLIRKNKHCKICEKELKLNYKSAMKYCSDKCKSIGLAIILEKKFHTRQRKKYNLSKVEYQDLMSRTSCEICDSSKSLCIDHCHSTEEVRGILCLQCNTALGKFKDDVKILSKAIKYLKREM